MPNLARHNLPVGATNVNASIQASLVMSICNVTAKRLIGPSSTVIRTLKTDKEMYIISSSPII